MIYTIMSSSTSNNTVDDFKPFFGWDEKGRTFVSALYQGTEYSATNFSKFENLQNTFMHQLLRAANYNLPKGAPQGMQYGSEDIPLDVVNMVIRTALFHREIDQTTTKGTNLGTSFDAYERALTEFLNFKPENDIAFEFINSRSGFNLPALNGTPINSQILSYLAGNVDLYNSGARAANAATFTASTTDQEAMNNIFHQGNGVPLGDYGRTISNFNYILRTLVQCRGGNPQNYNRVGKEPYNPRNGENQYYNRNVGPAYAKASGQLCFMSIFSKDPNRDGVALETNVYEKLMEVLRTAFSDARQQADALDRILQKVEGGLFKGLANTTADIGRRMAATPGVINVADFVKNNPGLFDVLKNNLSTSVDEALRDAFSTVVRIPHTTLQNDYSNQLFKAVHSRWPDLDNDARLFYKAHCVLMGRGNTSVVANRPNAPKKDWVRLADNEIESLLENRNINKDDYRLNLMKASSGSRDTLFKATLPVVPKVGNNKLWYTDSTGAIQSTTNFKEDALGRLYDAVYTNYSTRSVGATGGPNPLRSVDLDGDNAADVFNLPASFKDVEARNGPFNFDYKNLIKNTTKGLQLLSTSRAKEEVDLSKVSIDDFDFLEQDMVTGTFWYKDNNGYYYKDRKGQRVDYQGEEAGNCQYIKGDEAKCRRVMDCLVDGDYKNLHKCLEFLKDKDLWETARVEAAKVDPDTVKLVLKKFGVRAHRIVGEDGQEYRVPMTYEQWMNGVVSNMPPHIKDAITNNPNLTTYIKGLLHVVRENPAIINGPNVRVSRFEEPASEFATQLGISLYKPAPTANNKVNNKINFNLLADSYRNVGMSMNQHYDQSMFAPMMQGYMPAGNVNWVGGQQQQNMLMFGGGKRGQRGGNRGETDSFSRVFFGLKESLAEMGATLHKEDEVRIENAIKKIEKLEKQLSQLFGLFGQFVQIARSTGVPIYDLDKSKSGLVPVLDLDSVRDYSSHTEFVRHSVRELLRNMTMNLDAQTKFGSELYKNVFADIARKLAGDQAVKQSNGPVERDVANWEELTD